VKIYTVTGCIAAGKSSVAKAIAENRGFHLIREMNEKNPFLTSYYEDMKRWSFQMQLWYLKKRFEQLIKNRDKGTLVQDQMLAAFGAIFPTLQHELGVMDYLDYRRVHKIYSFVLEDRRLQPFDETIFYLRIPPDRASEVVSRTERRGRKYEKTLNENYLLRLIEEYERWFRDGTRRCYAIDAFLPKDEVIDGVLKVIEADESKASC
jgi:deoxyadenosine/deoxycytidine kinase